MAPHLLAIDTRNHQIHASALMMLARLKIIEQFRYSKTICS